MQHFLRSLCSHNVERVVGILVREAKVTQGLDFFGSWERLQASRDQRYDRMLERLIR